MITIDPHLLSVLLRSSLIQLTTNVRSVFTRIVDKKCDSRLVCEVSELVRQPPFLIPSVDRNV